MKRLATLSLVFAMLASLAACAAPPPGDSFSFLEKIEPTYPAKFAFTDTQAVVSNRKANRVSATFDQALSQFAYETAAPILQANTANALYSPISLYIALSLAGSGANGATQSEILALLGISDTASLLEQNGRLYRLLYSDNEISQLKIANSLWLDDEYNGETINFKESFTKSAVDSFYASLFKVDFARESTSQAMARWISENTNNTLKPDFKPDPEQIMSIINTIYFRDEWINRFDAELTQADTFHLANGQTMTCDFLNQINGSADFSRGDGFTRAVLPFKSWGGMAFILPDRDVDLSELISSPEKLKESFEGGQSSHGKVTWKIPKFTCDSKFDLVDTLKSLGIQAAFGGDADFSGMTDHQAFISSIIQNTHIALDEKGVEASAFTKIDYVGAAMPEGQADMILDRPFLYGIYSVTGQLLFIGICGNPGSD